MFNRCYDAARQELQPTYADCSVQEEWWDYQQYAKWYSEHKTEGRSSWQIDKDILVRGNKIYGPSFCCVVPQEVNLLLGRRASVRGEYPIGVEFHEQSGKFRARLSAKGGTRHLGLFDTPELAFLCYKEAKEKHIKFVADKYKGVIDDNVHDALYRYVVLLTD
jgi:hypothetical protein